MNTAIQDLKKMKLKILKFNINIFNKTNFTLLDIFDTLIHVQNTVTYSLIELEKSKINFNLFDTEFISQDIIDNNSSCLFYKFTYKIKIHNFNIKLVIYSKKKSFPIKRYILKIAIMCLFSNHKKDLTITILMLKDKKLLPKNGVLGNNSLNSGFTFYNNNINSIVIFREEELEKVLLHELIHALHLDLLETDYDIEFKASNYFQISPVTEIRINEAFTDFWAIILNIMIDTLIRFKTINKKTEVEFLKQFEIERQFTLLQTAKIINYMGFNTIYDFTKYYSKDSIHFKQTKPAFSYFFVKASLFFNIQMFIREYYKTPHKFKDIVLTLVLNKTFLKELDKIMMILKKKNLKNNYLLKTMRMTLL